MISVDETKCTLLIGPSTNARPKDGIAVEKHGSVRKRLGVEERGRRGERLRVEEHFHLPPSEGTPTNERASLTGASAARARAYSRAVVAVIAVFVIMLRQ